MRTKIMERLPGAGAPRRRRHREESEFFFSEKRKTPQMLTF